LTQIKAPAAIRCFPREIGRKVAIRSFFAWGFARKPFSAALWTRRFPHTMKSTTAVKKARLRKTAACPQFILPFYEISLIALRVPIVARRMVAAAPSSDLLRLIGTLPR
jgi:hypothetical protein